MKGVINVAESVAMPRREYLALLDIAQSVLYASESAAKVSFPGAQGYLVHGYHWECVLNALAVLVTPLEVVTTDESEEQTA